jgi:hypothetical protein
MGQRLLQMGRQKRLQVKRRKAAGQDHTKRARIRGRILGDFECLGNLHKIFTLPDKMAVAQAHDGKLTAGNFSK